MKIEEDPPITNILKIKILKTHFFLHLMLLICEEIKVLHQTLELKLSRIQRRFILNPLLMDIGSLRETCGREFSSLEYKWNDFCTYHLSSMSEDSGEG